MTTVAPTVTEVPTEWGPARITRHDASDARGLLLLGHSAGGGISAPDLLAATAVALDAGVSVGLVEQPYRVAGRGGATPVTQLDGAWLAVVAHVGHDLPLIFGGRSAGARVACRTAVDGRAAGVLCLAFPLVPPWAPDKPRLAELEAPAVPILVVQGVSDHFGVPESAPGRAVVVLKGNHSLKSDMPGLRTAIATWLPLVLS
jgi:uncharacterized protein